MRVRKILTDNICINTLFDIFIFDQSLENQNIGIEHIPFVFRSFVGCVVCLQIGGQNAKLCKAFLSASRDN